jgi:hypothetical protein
MVDGEDWLTGMDGGPVIPLEQQEAALAFAQNYLVFVDDARGRALLDHWRETLSRKRVGPAASVQEYAYAEAQRAFVLGIEEQLRFATSQR